MRPITGLPFGLYSTAPWETPLFDSPSGDGVLAFDQAVPEGATGARGGVPAGFVGGDDEPMSVCIRAAMVGEGRAGVCKC
jgi:hypothetical protein